MCRFLKKLLIARKRNKFRKTNKLYDSFYICPNHIEGASGKGADIWGDDWIIPVAENFEWKFYDDTNTGKQYIRTILTDYIFWFIPFRYDEYIYEVPAGTFAKNTLTTKDVTNMIYDLEHWNWHTDIMTNDRNYAYITIYEDGRYNTYDIGNNDYDFIRTK